MDAKDKIDAEMNELCEKLTKAQGATEQYDSSADPEAPYTDKQTDASKPQKPKITLPESAIKRKKKEEKEAKMNKSTSEMIAAIVGRAEELGSEGLKKAVSTMAPEQKRVLLKILEKGRKPAPIGTKSPDGKQVKTADGWKPVKGSDGSSKKETTDKPKKIKDMDSKEYKDFQSKMREKHPEAYESGRVRDPSEKKDSKPKSKDKGFQAGQYVQLKGTASSGKITSIQGSGSLSNQTITVKLDSGVVKQVPGSAIMKKSEGEDMEKEELTKAASKYDGATEKPMPKKVEDLPQTEVKDGNQYEWGDRKDEDVMKEKDRTVRHQGDNSPEGFEGQEVADPKTQPDWEAQAAAQPEQKQSAVGGLMKALEKVFETEEGIEKFVNKALEKGISEEELTEKLAKAGYEKMCKKCAEILRKKKDQMNKSVSWNNWNADALGSTAKRGRNAHYSVDEAIEKSETTKAERLAKGEFLNVESNEELRKSEDGKVDTNDIIEKGLDKSENDVIAKAQEVTAKPRGAFNTQSFSDEDLAKSLHLTPEQIKAILGE